LLLTINVDTRLFLWETPGVISVYKRSDNHH